MVFSYAIDWVKIASELIKLAKNVKKIAEFYESERVPKG